MKRFWKTALPRPIDGQWQVLLDNKPLHTPARALLLLPNEPLANAIADEWQAVADRFEPVELPLTALANAAIDLVADDRAGFLAPLARYAAFDLLCYRAERPAALVARQTDCWEPLLQGVEARHRLLFHRASGIRHVEQPEETLAGVRALFSALSAFELAALHPILSIGGSAVLAIAHLDGALNAEEVFDASMLDETFQQQQWGADDEALRVRERRRAEFLAAARFLALARGE